jgi:DNA-directed RNA polymerase subunit L
MNQSKNLEYFETFFEDSDQALEYVFGDVSISYQKFWEGIFMPNMKETAEKLKVDVKYCKDIQELESLQTKLKKGITSCEEIIASDGMTMEGVIRSFLAFWCGAVIVGGIPFLINFFRRVGTDDTPYKNAVKSAKQGKELLTSLLKESEKKMAEFKKFKAKAKQMKK